MPVALRESAAQLVVVLWVVIDWSAGIALYRTPVRPTSLKGMRSIIFDSTRLLDDGDYGVR
jgi:hypothetical protein